MAASLLLGSGLQMFAQDVNDNEITVKDKDGREEVIDVPESMDTEFDDLLQEYYSATTATKTAPMSRRST